MTDGNRYVNELIGPGINLVTVDYPRGAVGFWIERGALAYPVEEITVAGNLKEMLLGIEMVGNNFALHRDIALASLTRVAGLQTPTRTRHSQVRTGRRARR
jgi:predicted Zn-dependent protease